MGGIAQWMKDHCGITLTQAPSDKSLSAVNGALYFHRANGEERALWKEMIEPMLEETLNKKGARACVARPELSWLMRVLRGTGCRRVVIVYCRLNQRLDELFGKKTLPDDLLKRWPGRISLVNADFCLDRDRKGPPVFWHPLNHDAYIRAAVLMFHWYPLPPTRPPPASG